MANKKLGQYFLQNGEKLDKICNSLNIKNGDLIIEIGPGRGELTEKLIESGGRVVCVEKDKILSNLLIKKFGPRLSVINSDIREKLSNIVDELDGVSYMIAGNIPYYITGYILRTIGSLQHKPNRVVFTIQKEVAERIAKTNEVGMNILAASLLWWSNINYVTTIPRSMFSPRPRVDSAVVLLTKKEKILLQNPDDYMKFIKILFRQPRKKAVTNLSSSYKKDNILKLFFELGIDVNTRPERLSFIHIFSLYKKLL